MVPKNAGNFLTKRGTFMNDSAPQGYLIDTKLDSDNYTI
jgi:hypothetical protein